MNLPTQVAAAPTAPVPDESPALRWKVITLLVILALTIVGTSLYILYARGAFERHQTVVLRTEDAGGVDVGMPLTFAGFSIGRITRIRLGDDGYARLVVEVPERDAKW
jgi:phospholipid/cholesterol/gamma-HCH transport system substrate-binding protein